MNVPMKWLNEYVKIDTDIKSFIEDMTLSGSKVEAVECLGEQIKRIIVGKIIELEKHPDADKLFVTKTDVGKEILQIVTGADNLFVGAYVPVAANGAVLADGKKIKSGKLRGVESNGMLCSIEELGYTRHDYPESPENGIYIFTDEHEPGADVRPILELCDEVVEYEITSNRPDCFSVIGIAREAAATYNKKVNYPEIAIKENGGGDINEMISVEILNPELCPRYVARAIKNVKIEPSPQWLRHKLTACGIRPINNIVDITNYVMLEMGQPMHAFDIDNVSDRKIIVKNAKDGDMFTTLDGIDRKLDETMLVISDPKNTIAIAGIMGGENSKITENATAVLFESATFNGTNIRLSSKKLGLRTDASGKYEKGIDPELALLAVNRAVSLVEQLNCGEVIKGYVDCYPNKQAEKKVNYNEDSINSLLGTQLSRQEMINCLERLEIKTVGEYAVIPSFRSDLECEADIAEEVARIYGYNNMATTLASGTPTIGKKNKKQIFEDAVKEKMISCGFCEALTYAFESPKVLDKLRIAENANERKVIKITNPLGEDYSIMRTTTMNGILSSLSTNYNRRNDDAWIFELSKVYIPKTLPLSELPDEVELLTAGMYGLPEGQGGSSAVCDFYVAKGSVEALLDVVLAEDTKVEFVSENEIPFTHPNRTAKIMINGEYTGFVGEVHPEVLDIYEIGVKAYVFVIQMKELLKFSSLNPLYKQLPKYPSIKRDIAMLVQDEIEAAQIEKLINEAGGKNLEKVKLFDVFKSDKLPIGMKSMAYSMVFCSNEKTLTDEEVNPSIKNVLSKLETELGAQMRY